MAAGWYIYKVLFFVQSALFIFVMMAFVQNSDSFLKHVDKRKDQSCHHSVSDSVLRAYRQEAAATFRHSVHHLRDGATARGPLSNCTLEDILRRPGVVVLTTTNTGFMDMTLNMLKSISRIGVCVNITVVAEDRTCFDQLSKLAEGDPAVHVVLTKAGETRSGEIATANRSEYFALLNKREGYTLSLLERGYDVLFSDSDTFWFQDPFPYFAGSFDMSMMDPRSPYPLRTPKSHYCAGFAYFKPTEATIEFVKAWIEAMKNNHRIGKLVHDQNVLNYMLRADEPGPVNVQPLNSDIFPPGPLFYKKLDQDPDYRAVVMHAASIHGKAAKIKKFKSSNMWLMNNTVEYIMFDGD